MTKIKLMLLLCVCMYVKVNAQVKIGDNVNTINSASLLELETTNKGFVPPRIALVSLNSPSPLPAVLLTGTVIFNTASGVGTGIGLYYWSGTAWVPAGTGAVSTAWSLNGNSGTNSGTNFLGTINNVSIRFRTNGTERMVIDSNGRVGIGTTAPPNALSVIATNPLYLSGLAPLASLTGTDSILTITAGVVKKAPSSLFSGGGGGNGWLITGNSGTSSSTNFVGNSDDRGLTFRVNNITAGFLGTVNDGSSRTSLGISASTSAQFSTAIGASSIASNSSATALGNAANASGQFSIAIGLSTAASTTDAIAIGSGAKATGQQSIAIGKSAIASVQNGISIGTNSSANTSPIAMAIGDSANASGDSSTAVGDQAISSGTNSLALGVKASATGAFASAIGNGSLASGNNTVVYGIGSQATAFGATALGNNSLALGVNSTALGDANTASGASSLAIGDKSTASGDASIAMGNNTVAGNTNTVVIGTNVASGQANAFILGNNASNIGIGTATPNPATKLDVNGSFKLGASGTPLTNIIKTTVTFNTQAVTDSTPVNLNINVVSATANATIIVNPRSNWPIGLIIDYAFVTTSGTVTLGLSATKTINEVDGVTVDITIIQ